jgi:putative ATPase
MEYEKNFRLFEISANTERNSGTEKDIFVMLFDNYIPLAVKARPTKLEEYFGQTHLISEGRPIFDMIKAKVIKPMIFYGPPGSGKTSMGYMLKNYFKMHRFVYFSAASSGVPDLRKKVNEAIEYKKRGIGTIIFVDEIHRFNKLQQDFLLPFVENADFILIGATTENPSFYINPALLSRCRVHTFKSLKRSELFGMAKYILRRFYPSKNIEDDILYVVIDHSGGDARTMLNIIESLISKDHIDKNKIKNHISSFLRYDKHGDEHYNSISALIKSMRAGEADAALYYLARMLENGEDPRFIARRMVIFASEDIGMADSQALNIAVSTYTASEKIGMPEVGINLSHCVVYLSKAKKDKSSYFAYKKAVDTIREYGNLPIPSMLVNRTSYNLNIERNEDSFLPDKLKSIKFLEE